MINFYVKDYSTTSYCHDVINIEKRINDDYFVAELEYGRDTDGFWDEDCCQYLSVGDQLTFADGNEVTVTKENSDQVICLIKKYLHNESVTDILAMLK